jgi:replicative DNA helicase
VTECDRWHSACGVGVPDEVPPHSDEAEQSVIGALLNENSVYDAVGQLLAVEDFYQPVHRAIWHSCVTLIASGRAADVITVHDHGQHDLKYLNEMAMSLPAAFHVVQYARIIRQRALLRVLMAAGQRLRAGALAPSAEPCELMDGVVSHLLSLQQQQQRSEPQDMQTLAVQFLDDLQARADGRLDAVGTGLTALDRLTAGGGRSGELWVIGARPSMGKTALVLTLARHVGQAGRALMLTQEDSLAMLTMRHVAAAGRVNLGDLRSPERMSSAVWEGVVDGVEAVRGLGVSMDDQPALTLADVRHKAQQVMARHKRLDLVVVDYLQLMDGAGGENRNRELGIISNGLKRMAKELGTWVVLLSQLNREADKRRPIMSDLRDSGDIEGAADLIGLLYREFRYKPKPENKHLAELEIVKHKNGPTDTVRLWFDGATQRFGDWAQEDQYGA